MRKLISHHISYIEFRYLAIFFAILIAVQPLIWFQDYNFITVLNDEFGYWGNAALFSGYDWSDLLGTTPYYSFGYSLLLVPVLLTTNNVQIWYRYAIVINGLLLVLSYFLCFYTLKLLFKNISKKLILLASFVVISYTPNIVYAEVAWSETLLVFLIWLISYLIARNSEHFSIKRSITIFLILFLSLFCHPRMVPIYVLGNVVIAFQIYKQNIDIPKMVGFLTGLVILTVFGYLVYNSVKNLHVDLFWNNSLNSNVNNVNISDSSAKYLYTLIHQPLEFLTSLTGKIDTALLSTSFLLFVPLATFGYRIAHISEKKWREEELLPIYIWILGIAFGMIVLTSFQAMDWASRKDLVVYTRYFDFALGPLLAVAICEFKDRSTLNKWTVSISFLFFLISIRYIYQRIKFAEGQFNSICSPIIGAFVDNIENIKTAFFFLVLLCVLLLALLIIYQCYSKKNLYLFVLVIIGLSYILTSYFGAKYVLDAREYFGNNIDPIYQYVIQDKSKDLIYLESPEYDASSVNPKYLQYWIPDRVIQVMTLDEFTDLPKSEIEDKYIVLINSQDLKAHKTMVKKKYSDQGVKDSFLRVYE